MKGARAMTSRVAAKIGLYTIQPIPMKNRDVDRAKENGNDVTPRTISLLICGVSSTKNSKLTSESKD